MNKKFDTNGRIVIPREMKKQAGLSDTVEISVEGDTIVLRNMDGLTKSDIKLLKKLVKSDVWFPTEDQAEFDRVHDELLRKLDKLGRNARNV